MSRTLTPNQKHILKRLIDEDELAISGIGEMSPATVYKNLSILESLQVRNDTGVLRFDRREQRPAETWISRMVQSRRHLKAGMAKYVVKNLMQREERGDPYGPLFIDCGSTCAEIGRQIALAGGLNCPIITVNLLVLKEFEHQAPEYVNLIVLSGEIDWNRATIVSPVDTIRQNCFGVALVGADHLFTDDGSLGQASDGKVPQKEAIVESAHEVFFVIDQSKLASQNRNSSEPDELVKPVQRHLFFKKNHLTRPRKITFVIGVDAPPVSEDIGKYILELKNQMPLAEIVLVNHEGEEQNLAELEGVCAYAGRSGDSI